MLMRQNVLGLGSAKLLGGLALLGSCALLTGCEGGSGAVTTGAAAYEQATIGGDQQAETNSETPPLPGAASQSVDESGDGPGNNGNGNGNNGSDDVDVDQTQAAGTVEQANIDPEQQPPADSEALAGGGGGTQANADCELFCEMACESTNGYNCMDICGPCGELLAPLRHCALDSCDAREECVYETEDTASAFYAVDACIEGGVIAAMADEVEEQHNDQSGESE